MKTQATTQYRPDKHDNFVGAALCGRPKAETMETSTPKRKQIRLRDYDYAQNNAYFVTICTHNRARLFETGSETGRMAEKWLFELENKYDNIRIEKYIVMPDHVHFILLILVKVTATPLYKMIDWFKTMTTNEYIRGVKAGSYPPFVGHVWQRNYYEHILRSEQEMLEAWKYIDNNPCG
ncbi:MAG: transposase [Bacillota bacterium]